MVCVTTCKKNKHDDHTGNSGNSGNFVQCNKKLDGTQKRRGYPCKLVILKPRRSPKAIWGGPPWVGLAMPEMLGIP